MILHQLQAQVLACRKYPHLVRWREKVKFEKIKGFTDCTYWGRPVTDFGDSEVELIIVGLALAVLSANRTGRMFTSDRSGAWLFHPLYKVHFADQAALTSRKIT
jgi:uracil-DNA glycosylase